MSSLAMGRGGLSPFGGKAGVPAMKASARNQAAVGQELFEPRAARGNAVQPPKSARTGGTRARDRLVQRPTTTAGDGGSRAGGGGEGGGGEDFVARQRKREGLRAARLEARRQEIEQEERSRPTPAPSGLAGRRRGGEGGGFEGGGPPSTASGGRPVSREGGRRPSTMGGPGSGGLEPALGRRARTTRAGSTTRTRSRGGTSRNSSPPGAGGRNTGAPAAAPRRAKAGSGAKNDAVHPQSAAGQAIKAKKMELRSACQSLAIFRAYVKHDNSGRGQTAFDKLIALIPTELKAGEPKKTKSKNLTGDTMVDALQSLATYVQSNEDYGSKAFRELGSTLPFAAAAADDALLLDYLASAGIDVGAGRSGDGVTPLMVATIRKSLNAIGAILSGAPDCVRFSDSNGYTPLLLAAEDGDWEVGRALLSHDKAHADVDWALPDGTTALIIAAEGGEAQFIEMMIASGAELNATLKDGTTALFMAAQEKHADCCGLLLTACDPQVVTVYANMARHDGFTPLMIASTEGSWECAELMLRAGADMDATTKDGSSALLMAAQNGHDIVLELLISNGADIDCDRDDGVSPLQAALEGNHEEAAQVLVAAGAKV